jgi:hypothetical protein
MATIKKTAKKTVAAKKPAAKKPVVKKTAAAKKPAAKKPATKTAAKKPAAKKTVSKKPATKVAATKAAVKKTAPAKKPSVKTASTKAAPVKKPVPAIKKKVEAVDDGIKYRNLFDAYIQGKLPFAHGYIVSSFFSPTSAYSIYEIVSYAGVKEIFMTETGLQFITGGKKLFILIEPDTYHFKPVEPVSRAEGERIPKRFNELETIIAKNQSRIMVAKEPNETYGSFTILRPQGINFSIVFYQMPNVYDSLAAFFEDSFNRQRKIPQSDARKAAALVVSTLKKSMSFEGEFK